jgi:hypothetical protein
MRRLRPFLVTIAASAVAMFALAASVAPASAYGSAKIYELTYSANCDNPSSALCAPFPAGFGLGGAWGWFEVDGSSSTAASGTADGTATFCAHASPAFHINLSDTPWMLMTGAQIAAFNTGKPLGLTIFPVDFPGSPTETYIVLPAVGIAFPNVPGHYSAKAGPGVSIESTVTAVR